MSSGVNEVGDVNGTLNNNGDESLAVNGKIDLGVRKLVVSHVENATSIFAYESVNSPFMSNIKLQLAQFIQENTNDDDDVDEEEKKKKKKKEESKNGKEEKDGGVGDVDVDIVKGLQVGDLLSAFSESDQIWYRGQVETLDVKGKVRVRYIDFGFNELLPIKNLKGLPRQLKELPVYCEKYKMADLKPKGRADGFSAQDREKGAKWLKATIGTNIVKAACHEVIKYKGGIMMDAEVNGHNLNNLALRKGFAIPSPSLSANNPRVGNNRGGGGNGYNQPPSSSNMMSPRIPYGNDGGGGWDQDYLDYNRYQPFGKQINMKPAGFIGNQGGNGGNQDVKKLKGTVTKLENTLVKKNKELDKLKKKTESSYPKLGETIVQVRDLRGHSNFKERIIDSSRLLKDIFTTLKTLASKSVEAENACTVLRGVKEQIESSNGSGALQKSLKNAKKSVDRYVGSYVKEYANIKPVLDEGCKELTSVLESQQKPVIQKNETLTAEAKDKMIQEAVEQIEAWSLEYQASCQAADNESIESLNNLSKGLNDMSANLVGLKDGSVSTPSLPNLDNLFNKCQNAFNKQHTLLSGDKSSNPGYAKTMTKMIPAIITVLDMKTAADNKAQEYAEVFQHMK